MNLTIIFPVYNEVGSIEKVLLEWILELKRLGLNSEIIVCEDGSTDGTDIVLKRLKGKFSLTLNQKANRRGYSKALIDGIKLARYDNILCVDSDGQCDPKDLKYFIQAYGKADVLMGRRVNRADITSRILYSKMFGLLFYTLFPTHINDPSAPYTLFSKKRFIKLSRYLLYLKEGFWWGFVATCVKQDISIYEIPINHRERYDGETQVYKPSKILNVAGRNIVGLIKLKFAGNRLTDSP